MGFAARVSGRFSVSWLSVRGFRTEAICRRKGRSGAHEGPRGQGGAARAWAAPPYHLAASWPHFVISSVFWKLRAKIGPWATFAASEDLHILPNDTSEGRGSSEPVDFRTVEHTSPFNEPDDPIDSETAHANLPPSAGDTCDTEGSVRNDDADHNAFVDAAVEETRASPMKRSIGGFADEDDLLDFDDTFIEPPPKRARSDAVSPAAAASEASALKAAPVMQASTASSLSKGKDAPAAAAAPPSDLRGVISSLEAFASQFTSLEADKIRLQEEAKSSSSKLEGAIKKAAIARQEVDSLKEELNKLKERLKEEEARTAEKDELLRQSALALLEAADIPATALDKIPSNSPANGVSTVLAAHQLTRGLLDKGKGALARMHSMIFPKATQEKTLGQLLMLSQSTPRRSLRYSSVPRVPMAPYLPSNL
ncbi:hypothetical protein QYE76_013307 [Lolium multiflorum]|uniref:Uncharacterized protein n=1 Tax=Lolium multiflorum TaxID=4521 RepID=A0AAD8TYL5_LOLMU|nr:hypothetical protein QYE76_013307 [Lolium multiflorum]